MSVAKAIVAVMGEIKAVEKNGTNDHFKFKYQAWDDVLPEVRNACIKHGLTIIPGVQSVERSKPEWTDKYGEKNIAKIAVVMAFTLICGDSQITTTFYGEALDIDDKAIQKAITSATKYFFLKTFMIPIAGEQDPDGDGTTNAPKPTKAQTKQEEKKVDAERAEKIKDVTTKIKSLGVTPGEYSELKGICEAKRLSVIDLSDEILKADPEIDGQLYLARVRDAVVSRAKGAA